ncbi:MAG: hypothetical protein ACRERU_12505 [Methylococcales bacterium]
MQCYERQAMYLKLYADAVLTIPRLKFDPNRLEEVLCDFEIDRFSALIALDNRQRGEIITQLKSATDGETPCDGDTAAGQDCVESEEYSDFQLLNGMLAV